MENLPRFNGGERIVDYQSSLEDRDVSFQPLLLQFSRLVIQLLAKKKKGLVIYTLAYIYALKLIIISSYKKEKPFPPSHLTICHDNLIFPNFLHRHNIHSKKTPIIDVLIRVLLNFKNNIIQFFTLSNLKIFDFFISFFLNKELPLTSIQSLSLDKIWSNVLYDTHI